MTRPACCRAHKRGGPHLLHGPRQPRDEPVARCQICQSQTVGPHKKVRRLDITVDNGGSQRKAASALSICTITHALVRRGTFGLWRERNVPPSTTGIVSQVAHRAAGLVDNGHVFAIKTLHGFPLKALSK